jgi:hypothetical protein
MWIWNPPLTNGTASSAFPCAHPPPPRAGGVAGAERFKFHTLVVLILHPVPLGNKTPSARSKSLVSSVPCSSSYQLLCRLLSYPLSIIKLLFNAEVLQRIAFECLSYNHFPKCFVCLWDVLCALKGHRTLQISLSEEMVFREVTGHNRK